LRRTGKSPQAFDLIQPGACYDMLLLLIHFTVNGNIPLGLIDAWNSLHTEETKSFQKVYLCEKVKTISRKNYRNESQRQKQLFHENLSKTAQKRLQALIFG